MPKLRREAHVFEEEDGRWSIRTYDLDKSGTIGSSDYHLFQTAVNAVAFLEGYLRERLP